MSLSNHPNVLGGGGGTSNGILVNGVLYGLNGQTITGDANGAWAIAANGTNQSVTLTPSGTGQIFTTDGSATLPVYSFTSDPDTGIYRVAANTFGISAGGVMAAKFFVNAPFTTVTFGDYCTLAEVNTISGKSNAVMDMSVTGTGTYLRLQNTTNTDTSGSTKAIAITPTYNQTSGTAANTDLLINRTQTAVGSGAQLLFDAQVGGTSKLSISNTGVISKPGGTIPLITTTSAITSGGAASVGTLTNAPSAGNPTKWVPIDDNGVTRYIPAW